MNASRHRRCEAGINPAHNRQLERIKREQESATTFEAVANEWLALEGLGRHHQERRRLDMLTRVVFPKIGSLPVKSITPAHILDVLNTSAKKNGLTVAAEAKRTMSGVFELAVSTLRAESDPVYPVRKALPANKTQHKRPLDSAEIGQLLRDVEGHGGRHETITAFRLMWLTLCRPSEAVEARWDRIRPRRGSLADSGGADEKAQGTCDAFAHASRRNAAGAAWTSLAAIPISFPHRDDRTKPMVSGIIPGTCWMCWAGAKKYSPHATRTTGSTRLNELGFSVRLDRATVGPCRTECGAANLQSRRILGRPRQDDAAMGGHAGYLEEGRR